MICIKDFEEKEFEKFENEIKLYYCGKRFRSMAHSYGPYEIDRYLIYFIKEGKATLTLENGEILILNKGFFVNFPKSRTQYQCDENTPWTIKWIMVNGEIIGKYLSLLGITRQNPYIKLNESCNIEAIFDEMYEHFDKSLLHSKIYCISLIHKLFSTLAKDMAQINEYNDYVVSAKRLIEENYFCPEFNVSALAERMGLHHNYLSVLYKRETGQTLIKTITDYRLQNACKMLIFTNKSINEVAHACGFSDELYFSRIFKRTFGVPPKVYRENKNISI